MGVSGAGKGFRCRKESPRDMRKFSRHLLESRICLLKQGQNGRCTEKSRKQRPLVRKQPSRPKKEPELLIGKVIYIGELNPHHHGISIILLA